MNGTGTLKTDGTSAGGFRDFHADGDILLLSDVYVNGNYSNKGTIWFNGFRIYNNGTYYDGIPPPDSPLPSVLIKFNFQMTNGFTVLFTDQTVGGVVSYLWDFGDGTTSVERNPIHEYTQSGTYMASLTITDFYGVKQVLTKKITVQRPITEEIFSPYAIAMMSFFAIGVVGYFYYDSKPVFLITVLSWGAFAVLFLLLIL
jgi:hypothetical protein